ncbi:MAG: hypothetical protein H6819_00385 [Phycisphaerales bacterium]|nr:hypothetical protein [Phycisphaerales bacterium]MCB9857334.1 hypothetical protein [Phycisphaerales bacterium]MCB9862952.1 hypothetical protein [Phycisphaerales bacterium]
MKRALTVLMGAAVLALTANRAHAVAYGPAQPGEKGGGFARWDANDDGVIDKAEFQAMRKALKKQHREDGDKPKARRDAKARRGPGDKRPDGPPLRGPKADGGDHPFPGPQGPAMGEFDDDGPRAMDRPSRRGRGMQRGGRDGMRPRPGMQRGAGRGFAERRGGDGCPECGCKCPCCRGKGQGRGMPGPRGPMGPEFGAMGPAHGGHGFGPGPMHGFSPHGDMMPGPGGCPFLEQHRNARGREFGMMRPGGRGVWRQFAMRARRLGQRARAMGPRMFDRFDENNDNFITPDEFPGRPERFDRWDADDDGRIEKGEIRRHAKRNRDDGAKGDRMKRGGRGRGGPRDADRDDDDAPRRPRGPRTDKTRAI